MKSEMIWPFQSKPVDNKHLQQAAFNSLTWYRPLSDVTIAGPPWWPVWCCLYSTVYRRKRAGNTQNGGIVLPIVNLIADSESERPVSYLSFLVTICLSCLVSELSCDRETDGQQTDGRATRTITIAGPHINLL